jgi:hypothetical protein
MPSLQLEKNINKGKANTGKQTIIYIKIIGIKSTMGNRSKDSVSDKFRMLPL